MLALAVVVGVGLWLVGLPAMSSAILATAGFAAGAGRAGLELHTIDQRVGRSGAWPPRSSPFVGGVRREVQELSWSFSSRSGTSGQEVLTHLRNLARRRLAVHGVDLSDPEHRPRVDALIGSRARAVLATPGDRPVRHRDAVACLDAVERLVPSDTVSTVSRPPLVPSTSEHA